VIIMVNLKDFGRWKNFIRVRWLVDLWLIQDSFEHIDLELLSIYVSAIFKNVRDSINLPTSLQPLFINHATLPTEFD